uniref:Enoyl-CoA delta isomerase 2, peroxisomal-like n=1 Tax=Nelumbo nucifera TaxID=4432 RepID=A0A822YKN4_NELNU|nr:TPA_asm: hypothetical protein HUJ06_005384 [Nelumbo nucifera]
MGGTVNIDGPIQVMKGPGRLEPTVSTNLRILDLPFHAWLEEVFSKITKFCGGEMELLDVSNLHAANVKLVRVKPEMVTQLVEVFSDRVSYKAWIASCPYPSWQTLWRYKQTQAKRGSVLVTTEQGKFFSNGFDLAWAESVGSCSFLHRLQHMGDGLKAIMVDLPSLPMPTIAAVLGHAAAVGFMLALSHDYVLMRKDKEILYMSDLDIGLSLPDYFMALLRKKIHSLMARCDVVLHAAKVKAEEAVKMGFKRKRARKRK